MICSTSFWFVSAVQIKTISHENKRQILETEFEIEMTEELEEG